MGSELYVQPKDSRLRLEVEVANDNASKWHGHLVEANARNRRLRLLLRRIQTLIQQDGVDFRTPEMREDADNFMADLRKELG